MAKKKNENLNEEVKETVDNTVEPVVEETDSKKEAKEIKGKVVNCKKLNVRTNPSKAASVVCVVNVGDELTVSNVPKNSKWKFVRTADGKDGYCMSEFVEIIR